MLSVLWLAKAPKVMRTAFWLAKVCVLNRMDKAEEEVGRQHQGMDRPGVRQVPEGSKEQRKKEETGCEIICGTQTILAVKG